MGVFFRTKEEKNSLYIWSRLQSPVKKKDKLTTGQAWSDEKGGGNILSLWNDVQKWFCQRVGLSVSFLEPEKKKN